MGPVPAPNLALLNGIPPVSQKSRKFKRKLIFFQTLFALTSSGCITQLLADHTGINTVPAIMTHCPPLVIDAHLHSTLILIGTSNQTNITISTDSTGIYCSKSVTWCSAQKNSYTFLKELRNVILWFLQTLTSYSCIWVDRRTADGRASETVSEVSFTASALNFI